MLDWVTLVSEHICFVWATFVKHKYGILTKCVIKMTDFVFAALWVDIDSAHTNGYRTTGNVSDACQ
jgi:hypothetical protein